MPLKTQLDEQPTLNLTPMIDMLFLLIIFFMAATTFTSEERNVEVKVPQVASGTGLAAPTQKHVINVDRDGAIVMNSQTLTLAELSAALRQLVAQHPGSVVTVRGDGEGNLQNVAAVLSACKQAGVRDMAISVRVARRLE